MSFERALGQVINKIKTQIMATRVLEDPLEIERAKGLWPDCEVVYRMKILGLKVGIHASPEDIFRQVQTRIEDRIQNFRSTRMSLAMRIISCNVFLSTLPSYIGRVLMMPDAVLRSMSKTLRDFVLPVPVVQLGFLAHLGHVFGLRASLRCLLLTNLSGVAATALSLGHGHHLKQQQLLWRAS